MTLQSLPRSLMYPGFGLTNSSSLSFGTAASLTASGHYAAFVGRAKENMVISHVAVRIASVTGTCTVDARIETVYATTGLPFGTLWGTTNGGAGAATNIVSGTLSAGWTTLALTNAAVVNKGDYYAVKIAYNGGTTIAIGAGMMLQSQQLAFPYRVTNVGTPTKAVMTSTNHPQIIVGSSSTSFYQPGAIVPNQATSVTGSASTSTYDAIGIRFKLPFKARISHLTRTITTSAYGAFKYGIYDDAGSQVDSSETTGFDSNMMGDQANGPHLFLPLTNPATVLPDTWYRAAFWPTTTTAFVTHVYEYPSANHQAIGPGGVNWHYTRKAVGGAWDDSFTLAAMLVNLGIDQLDDGAGGGTSFRPLLAA